MSKDTHKNQPRTSDGKFATTKSVVLEDGDVDQYLRKKSKNGKIYLDALHALAIADRRYKEISANKRADVLMYLIDRLGGKPVQKQEMEVKSALDEALALIQARRADLQIEERNPIDLIPEPKNDKAGK